MVGDAQRPDPAGRLRSHNALRSKSPAFNSSRISTSRPRAPLIAASRAPIGTDTSRRTLTARVPSLDTSASW